MINAARPVYLPDGRHTGGPHPSDDVVSLDGCDVRLSLWEGEVLVCAAGWIAVIRGVSLTLGIACGFLSIRSFDPVAPWGILLLGLTPFLVALHGLGVLRRGTPCKRYVLLGAAAWLVWFASRLACVTTLGEFLQVDRLWCHPIRLSFLPAFLFPELLVWWALCRREGVRAFESAPRPVPSLLDALRLRRTPRILLASGAVALAFATSAAVALLLPGVLVAVWPQWM